jgi:hypothetical protein
MKLANSILIFKKGLICETLFTNESKKNQFVRSILMSKYFIIALLVIGKFSLAQSFEIVGNDTINYVDNNNLRQGFWVILNKVKKLPGYKEDQKVEEGSFKDSQRFGLWKQFFPSGKLKNEITYANNRPSGYAKMYFENGNIMEEGVWENNRWVGTYKQYYESGKVYYDWNYNNQGKREGDQKYYHENGKVMIEGNWQDGKENGTIKEYYDNGALKAEKVFNGGSIDLAASKEYSDKGTHEAHGHPKEDHKAVSDSKKEPAKAEVAKNSEESKTTSDNTKKVSSNLGVGIVADGYNKLYNSKKLVDKEGIFKEGKLWDGKQYEYNGVEISKIKVYKSGKLDNVISDKAQIEKEIKK